MVAELHSLNERDRALALVSSEYVGEGSIGLLDFLPASRSEEIRVALEKFFALPPEKRKTQYNKGIKQLRGKGLISLFYHADSAWISEAFRAESAPVLAILMEGLPKARVGGILKDLPKETRRDLKKVQLGKIPKKIQTLIRNRGESHFPRNSLDSLEKDAVLKKFYDLGLADLNKVLRELGLSEMALAFSKINRSAVRAILNRLRSSDAKELRRRMKKAEDFNLPDQREAQLHILSLDFEKLSPEEIISEIGFGVFSRAFGKGDREAALFFIHKFPPHQGYILKRYFDENSSQNVPEKITQTRERVLDAYTRIQ